MGRGRSSPSPSVAPTPPFFLLAALCFNVCEEMAKAQSRRRRGRGEGSCSDLWSGFPLTSSANEHAFLSRHTQKSHFTNLPLLFSLSSSSFVFVFVFLPTGRPTLSTGVPARKSWALLFLWFLWVCPLAWCGFFLVGRWCCSCQPLEAKAAEGRYETASCWILQFAWIGGLWLQVLLLSSFWILYWF